MNKSVAVKNDKPDLSVIVSMYNEEDSLSLFFKTINKTLSKLKKYTYEIICIDDGSKDKTYSLLEKYAKDDECIKVIKFSRNFGKEYGVMAGLKFCSGRCAIPMDVDLQDSFNILLAQRRNCVASLLFILYPIDMIASRLYHFWGLPRLFDFFKEEFRNGES